ncbi:flagellar export chaperone FlgN [Inmirania thermothiophila]|uniref:Flagellar biosynthesis/type III secretory pathway chaperone n=1 Tax=Inmirania thermothiophila TaxID=1750597 RepID=A0A3N1Y7W7_9GAMM|nr:flagellar export chaperone FlgN [Inmirania thermothiophila]ROR34903.1 flagellar biosynthesis/type III secretory pathway chaperone [Inmirania thermothiophila]
MSAAADPARAEALARILDETLAALDALAETLAAERRALARADAAAIAETARRKAELADRIDRAEARRREAAGSDAEAFEALLTRLDPAGGLGRRWAAVREAVLRCRRDNEINARIVQASSRRLEEALALLRGGDGTYGPDGAPAAAGTGSSIAKA